ncbi:hypothetical protein DERF_002073 [Dermatophagoides farinae]|uniref:Uncharacterized protein n=1 Tax=Dermatophagoides farinae TaxID=6954 RepID=A0A922LBP2_DERFA|nr:hypothetical protein DERF_002073 [Dermatophagoides farinae]
MTLEQQQQKQKKIQDKIVGDSGTVFTKSCWFVAEDKQCFSYMAMNYFPFFYIVHTRDLNLMLDVPDTNSPTVDKL